MTDDFGNKVGSPKDGIKDGKQAICSGCLRIAEIAVRQESTFDEVGCI